MSYATSRAWLVVESRIRSNFSVPDARRTHFTIAKAQPARLYSASGMNERYIRWWTPHMSRDFEMLVFGDARGLPLILFPTSFGRYNQNKDFGVIDACAPFVYSGKITIYCPDSADLDGFYNNKINPADRMRTHNAYERVIVDNVFDFARRERSCHRVAISGASLGAYHAANVAFRFPDAVSHLISLSGAFEISDFFDGHYDENIYFNSSYQYLPNMTDPWKYNHMNIILGTGEWDNTRHESFRLSDPARERHPT
jgi:esterase/lipase superfamily enzyme